MAMRLETMIDAEADDKNALELSERAEA